MTISFGAKVTADSGAGTEVAVSDDGQAFTLTYGDYQVEVNNGAGSPSTLATRWEWFVLPLHDHPQGDPFSIAVSGFAFTEQEAKASLLLSVNGVIDATRFEPGTEREFVRSVKLVTSGFDTELRVAVGVVVEGDPDAAASVTVSAIDGEVTS